MTRKQQDRAMLPPAFHPPMAEARVGVKTFYLSGLPPVGTTALIYAHSRIFFFSNNARSACAAMVS
jgi:hypothetical protein